MCVLLWNDYLSNLAEYERKYEAAVDTYNLYRDNANSVRNTDELLAYDRAMLEGYQYFQQSAASNTDMFVDGRDSVFYRSLYTDYWKKSIYSDGKRLEIDNLQPFECIDGLNLNMYLYC